MVVSSESELVDSGNKLLQPSLRQLPILLPVEHRHHLRSSNVGQLFANFSDSSDDLVIRRSGDIHLVVFAGD